MLPDSSAHGLGDAAEPLYAVVFAAPELWANWFSKTIAEHGLVRGLDGGDDYYMAWLSALEDLPAEHEIAAPDEVSRLRRAWKTAYMNTPHGAPVHLKEVD